jgi:peptide/nickel transport system permease protein
MELLHNKQVVIGGGIILAFVVVAIFAPWIAPNEYWKQDLRVSLSSPGAKFLFGTDEFGRDIFSRTIYGARVSLIAALGSAALASVLGLTLGLLAGYFGGVIDRFIQSGIDIAWAFPTVLLAIVIASMAKPGLGSTVLAITAVYWAQYARVIRGEVLSVREEEYVTAARASGCNHIRIMTHHIFPNVMAPVIVMITITTGYAILLEAMLSFLGVGVQPPTPSWGIILSEGRSFMSRAPWITIFPGVVITIAVLGFNFLGDGLRDYLDPYMKRL